MKRRGLGAPTPTRLSLCNALLGAVQAQAVLADGAGGVSVEQRDAAWREQLRSAGAADDPGALMGVLRWQALRFAGPLREIAAQEETGPIPLAAAHAADGLQALLEVIGAGQNIAAADVDALPGRSAPERSRSALQAAAGAYDEIELRPAETIDTATVGAVALSSAGGGDGDGDAPPPARERDRGDSADELDLDEAEALGELVELSPFWSGDPRDPGPEEP